MEYLEDLETCAVRETLEETGLSIINPRLEWVENSIFGQPDDLQHYITIFMRADLENRVSLKPPPSAAPQKPTPGHYSQSQSLPRSIRESALGVPTEIRGFARIAYMFQ